MAMARSLLKGTHMPARFWGEAVRHAVYLLNRLPTKALGERTPFEAWMGRKPHLAHLKVFGCIAYAKNTTPHLKKLDDRSSPMVYLGVEEGYKAHRLFDPRHNKLQVSRDVIFQENSEWTWNAGADKEDLPEFVVVNAFNTDEVIVTADIEAAAEDVTPSSSLSTPSSTRASSPSTPSSSTQATTSPESHEGPVRYRSIADIYANTEEIVGIDEEENEVMLMMSEEPTCYQEAATEACWSTEGINKFKQQMMTEFEMSDLGLLSYYLGIEVEQQKSRILLRQSAYAKKILSQFQMADCNATKQPMEPKTQLHKDLEGTPIDATEYRCVIGCLRYLLHTRPDLSYSVGMASRYMEKPTSMHHKVVKQILRYLKGTIYFGLAYTKGPQEISIFGYSDSDLAGDLDGRKSTSGMAFYFNESLVSWNSQKQKTVALSSCEAEFMAATTAACQALWLRSLVSELTSEEPKPVTLFVDNRSAIALMKNPVFHGRSKHIDTRFHFIRECIEKGQIVVEFVNTGEQRADALTKALPGVKLAAMRQLLGPSGSWWPSECSQARAKPRAAAEFLQYSAGGLLYRRHNGYLPFYAAAFPAEDIQTRSQNLRSFIDTTPDQLQANEIGRQVEMYVPNHEEHEEDLHVPAELIMKTEVKQVQHVVQALTSRILEGQAMELQSMSCRMINFIQVDPKMGQLAAEEWNIMMQHVPSQIPY
ncbi:hypothetical protein ZIOFF_062224 [Zingiber officinale]|uniref:Uncharacterized protein n=1 Tax=Zingiber officinale TaxID=94328 RepID=A0A8J5K986_ZINOF|nr:hypothetical protein ZIOFF_062224 [Zingiber officinale]